MTIGVGRGRAFKEGECSVQAFQDLTTMCLMLITSKYFSPLYLVLYDENVFVQHILLDTCVLYISDVILIIIIIYIIYLKSNIPSIKGTSLVRS